METMRYTLELQGNAIDINRLRGREAISEAWSMTAQLATSAPHIDPKLAIRQPASILLHRGDEIVRRIVGIVTDVHIRRTARANSTTITLESPLAQLSYRRDVRAFRDQTVVDIAAAVFANHRINAAFLTTKTYRLRPYTVQWRESDWNFVRRLFEDEGIFFFEDDGRVVVADTTSGYTRTPSLPFRPASGLLADEDVVFRVTESASMTVGRVVLRDFNRATPDLDMDANSDVASEALGCGAEHYQFPGGYANPRDGGARATLLAEIFACHALGFEAQSTAPAVAPGGVLALVDGPAATPSELVVKRVDHAWDRAAGGFTNQFSAMASETVFRPQRQTPKPQLSNPLTGFATGPAGADIHCNELGAVKVYFPWDREQDRDDRCSDWVPVLQENTGSSCNVPRVDWELLVNFNDGDPDRPVVLGRMYNGADPFPETLPQNKTRSALRSLSSPGRGGHNMIRLDDASGAEELKIHAEKDEEIRVANDKRCDVCADEAQSVLGDETIEVGADQALAVGGSVGLKIGGSQTRAIGGSRNLEVGAARASRVGGSHSMTIGGSHTRKAGTTDSVTASDINERIGGLALETSLLSNSTYGRAANSYLVGAVQLKACGESSVAAATGARFEVVGGVLVSDSGGDTTSDTTGACALTAGGAIVINATDTASLTAGALLSASGGTVNGKGASALTLTVGDSSVTLADGVVSVVSSTIILSASAANTDGAAATAEN